VSKERHQKSLGWGEACVRVPTLKSKRTGGKNIRVKIGKEKVDRVSREKIRDMPFQCLGISCGRGGKILMRRKRKLSRGGRGKIESI